MLQLTQQSSYYTARRLVRAVPLNFGSNWFSETPVYFRDRNSPFNLLGYNDLKSGEIKGTFRWNLSPPSKE
jgi:hypothetical protein